MTSLTQFINNDDFLVNKSFPVHWVPQMLFNNSHLLKIDAVCYSIDDVLLIITNLYFVTEYKAVIQITVHRS